ncbi:MAG: type II secretion system inner membrane protein GspF [Deltaproteobacteria bacterium]|nr:type II secretion system inner membrane protein GspF [Deltaproteobacteria bacterium]
MPTYQYRTIDAKGKSSSGVIEAETERVARTKLRKMGTFPIEVHLEGTRSKEGGFNRQIEFSKFLQRIKTQDIAVMTRQLSTLISANIPLVDSLAALAEQTTNPRLRSVLSTVKQKVVEGSRLADAMRGYPDVFSDLYLNMVNAGESSGALEIVLERLADLTEKQARLKSKIIGALMYPIIMGFVGISLMAFMFVYVVPKVTKIFEDAKATLPLPTKILIGISNTLIDYWWLLIILGIAGFFLLRRYVKTEKGRLAYDKMTLQVPLFGKLFRLIAISRFARTLATLLGSGVQLLTALDIVKRIVENSVLVAAIENTRTSVREGESLAEPLKRSGQFPPIVTHMISIGEKTGGLETMLIRIADTYDGQVDNTVSTLTTLLEPIMILMMGGIVSFIVMSILLPILQMNQLGV